jgi:[acyl-carrier-protein] S-malonyltransferase
MMRIAWCFPGQGSQFVGMGKDLAERFARARDVFDRADRALEKLSALCFEGPEADLRLTRNTQPAVLATSIAALAALREAAPGLALPSSAAGHSLGEYSALVASGAIGLEDALRLVRLRGEAMQAAVPEGEGAMAAIIGVASDALAALCEEAREGEVVAPANFNAPGQIVIAGHAGAVSRAMKLVAQRKGKAIPLKVSAPFHCSLMAPAVSALRPHLDAIPIGALSFPVIANVDAEPHRDPARVKDLLLRQIDHPVRWEETVAGMAADGVTHIFEIGPGKVLAGLVRYIAKQITVIPVGTVEGVETAAALVRSS